VPRPLSGLRILDFSRLLPGPYCTLLLSRLGADVVKVEDVAGGDPLRHFPPAVDALGAMFAFFNRGKRSISIDLKQAQGQAIAQDLAAKSDVVVEGFRPGVATRLGIDFPALAQRNPRLVYCSISGYGREGPLADLPGHDLTYAAMSGLLDALSPGAPRVPGAQLVDAASSLLAAVQILAALQVPDRGPHFLDVSLYDASRALMPGSIVEALSGPSSLPLMDTLRGSERNGVYRCADGRWLAVSPLEDTFWRRLCAALRAGGEISPDREPTSQDLRAIFGHRTCDDWFSLLSAAGVPCAPVLTTREAGDRPSAHPTAWAAASPDAPHSPHGEPAPALGEHTLPILRELGRSPEQIAQLERAGVVGLPAAFP